MQMFFQEQPWHHCLQEIGGLVHHNISICDWQKDLCLCLSTLKNDLVFLFHCLICNTVLRARTPNSDLSREGPTAHSVLCPHLHPDSPWILEDSMSWGGVLSYICSSGFDRFPWWCVETGGKSRRRSESLFGHWSFWVSQKNRKGTGLAKTSKQIYFSSVLLFCSGCTYRLWLI